MTQTPRLIPANPRPPTMLLRIVTSVLRRRVFIGGYSAAKARFQSRVTEK